MEVERLKQKIAGEESVDIELNVVGRLVAAISDAGNRVSRISHIPY